MGSKTLTYLVKKRIFPLLVAVQFSHMRKNHVEHQMSKLDCIKRLKRWRDAEGVSKNSDGMWWVRVDTGKSA